MTFLDHLGAAVGIGGSTVQVGLSTPVVGWEESARGTVVVRGGKVPQQLTALGVALIEHWTTTIMVGKTPVTQHHYETHDQALLAQHLAVGETDELRFEFALRAPWGKSFQRHWFVQASASIPNAVDRHAQCDFRLTAPAVFRAAAELLQELLELEEPRWTLRGAGARGQLRPAPAWRGVLDGVTLDLQREGEEITGQVVVNPQERSAADVVRSLIRADRVSTPIRFPERDPEALRPALEALAAPLVEQFEASTGPARQFPLPARRPADSPDSLPLPSNEGDEAPARDD